MASAASQQHKLNTTACRADSSSQASSTSGPSSPEKAPEADAALSAPANTQNNRRQQLQREQVLSASWSSSAGSDSREGSFFSAHSCGGVDSPCQPAEKLLNGKEASGSVGSDAEDGNQTGRSLPSQSSLASSSSQCSCSAGGSPCECCCCQRTVGTTTNNSEHTEETLKQRASAGSRADSQGSSVSVWKCGNGI